MLFLGDERRAVWFQAVRHDVSIVGVGDFQGCTQADVAAKSTQLFAACVLRHNGRIEILRGVEHDMAQQRIASGWERFFSETYLQRARSYVRSGRVARLEKKGSGWEAVVNGSSTYRVFVPAEGSVPFDKGATCTCPWFAKGHLCKHIAAVCYEVEAEAANGASGQKPEGEGVALQASEEREAASALSFAEQVNDFVTQASDADVRAFLTQVLLSDERLVYRFRSQFGAFDAKTAQRDLRHELSAIKKAYTYRGWIDYRSAFSFSGEYLDAAERALRPFAERGDADGVFALASVLVTSLRTVHIDDSDGFFSDAAAVIRWAWDACLDALAGDPAKRAAAAKNLCSLSRKVSDAKREGDIDWFLIDSIDEYAAKRLVDDPACADVVVDLADRRIEQAQRAYRKKLAEAECRNALPHGGYGGFSTYVPFDYETPRWVSYRVRAMYTAGASVQETMEFAEPFRSSYEVLDALAGVLTTTGDVSRAIRLFEDAWHSEEGQDDSRRFALRLRGLYREHGDVEKLRPLLEELLADVHPNDSNPSASQLLDELHAITPADAWPQVRDAVLERMASGEARCDCLAAEGLVERLVDELGRGTVRLRSPASYEGLLVDDHPELLVAWYAEDARKSMGSYAAGRKAYRAAAERLRHLAGLPGGADSAQEIADEWKRMYPRRPAMFEELARVGFA